MRLFQPYSKDDASYVEVPDMGSLLYAGTALWTGDSVRIAAIKPMGSGADIVVCFLWFTPDLNSTPGVVVNGVAREMQSYSASLTNAYIRCPFSPDRRVKAVPLYVGVGNETTSSFECKVAMQVENRGLSLNKRIGTKDEKQLDSNRVVEFTVCIPPMFNYKNAAQLVEKLEMVRLLGAGRVVLYKYKVEPNVNAVLDLYTQRWREGSETLEVVVRPWKLPPVAIHYYNQIAAIDDCLYRYGWLSHYMAFDDLDEIMMPFRHDNWSQLITERKRLRPDHVAFLFSASIMKIDHMTPAKGFEADAFKYGSSVLGYTRRDPFIFYPIDKGKLIVNPRMVDTLEVHTVWTSYGKIDFIEPEQALLYHYRWPSQPCNAEIDDTRVVDKFGKLLLPKLKFVWSKLKDIYPGEKLPKPDGSQKICIYNKGVESGEKKGKNMTHQKPSNIKHG